MSQLLKQSTAVDITILMVESATHILGKTGLSAGLTIYLSKGAGTPAVITPTVTELDATNVPGLYKLALTTTHTNTLGEFQLHITGSGADPTDVTHQVVLDLPGIAQTGDAYARLGAPAGASTAADIAAIQSDTNDIQTRLPAALVSGRMDSSVGAMASNVITAAAIATDAGAEIADAVWDEAISGHLGAGSTGAALNAAGSAGDPWSTPLPGAYGSGTAGKIIGDFIDATISSRLASSGYAAPPSVGAIADQVWDEALAGHVAAGSSGEALGVAASASAAAVAAIAALPTAVENATEFLDQAAGVETSWTVRQVFRMFLAALAGPRRRRVPRRGGGVGAGRRHVGAARRRAALP